MINLFINNKVSLEMIELILQNILEMDFEYENPDLNFKKGYTKQNVAVWLFSEHEFENDRDMFFEDFTYHIDFENNDKINNTEFIELVLANKVIDELSKIDDIKMMLVKDLQKILYLN